MVSLEARSRARGGSAGLYVLSPTGKKLGHVVRG